MTLDEILINLSEDNWFRGSVNTRTKVLDSNGIERIVSKSYYHNFTNKSFIQIRVSEHGTVMATWVEHDRQSHLMKQNLSVVFSDKAISSQRKMSDKSPYFVVEQYWYRPEKLTVKDFKKLISTMKKLGDEDKVFNDPLRKKPDRKANRTVLTPLDYDGNKIPSTRNPVHPRQTVVAQNRYNEVDALGRIVKDSVRKITSPYIMEGKLRCSEQGLHSLVKECVYEVLDRISHKKVSNY